MTTNDAAERLLDWVGLVEQPAYGENSIYDELRENLLPEALAAERRATVERIRKWTDSEAMPATTRRRLHARLDEEAAR